MRLESTDASAAYIWLWRVLEPLGLGLLGIRCIEDVVLKHRNLRVNTMDLPLQVLRILFYVLPGRVFLPREKQLLSRVRLLLLSEI